MKIEKRNSTLACTLHDRPLVVTHWQPHHFGLWPTGVSWHGPLDG